MSHILFHRFLKKAITHGTLNVTYAGGEQATYGEATSGYPDVAIRFSDDHVPRDIVMDPRLGAAETFMDDRLQIERGDIMDLIALLRSNAPWDRGDRFGRPSPLRRARNAAAFAAEQVNTSFRSRRNVAHHYDIGNELYRLMLDEEHMQYSCAYWPQDRRDAGMTLGEAQEAKLAHIAAKLAIRPGQRVLDIGCGWGGMAIFLARHYDVTVTAITLSEEQLSLAEQRADQAGVGDKTDFRLADYRELPGTVEPFDRIVSVGMFEHVGRPQFEAFFDACGQLLTPEGVMLLHTIGRMGQPGTTDAFTRKYIFPGGYIPALSETVRASEKVRLIATDVENLRLHYAHTLREWYRRCVARREAIVDLMDERFFRMWTFYLAGATAAFEHGGMCNFQIQFARNRQVLPITRDYMAAEERRLLGASA